MPETFIHGVQTIEISDGTRPIQTARSSIIGVIGTAPDADGDTFPINKPVLVAGNRHMLKDLGDSGTLPQAARMIFSPASPFVVFVRVQDDTDKDAVISNLVGSLANRTGCHAFLDADARVKVKPRILIAPGFTHTRPTDGIASISVSDAGTGYAADETVTVTIGGDGVAASARAVVSNGGISAIHVENSGQGLYRRDRYGFGPRGGGGVRRGRDGRAWKRRQPRRQGTGRDRPGAAGNGLCGRSEYHQQGGHYPSRGLRY